LFIGPNNTGPDRNGWPSQSQSKNKKEKKKIFLGRCKSGIKIPGFLRNVEKKYYIEKNIFAYDQVSQ
jgi:hypothetical protein